MGIAVDDFGNAYVTGETGSTQVSFPVVVGPDLTHNGGNNDAFVAKVKADGTGLAYCGYIGGGNYDIGNEIAVDEAGCAYVTGSTSSTQASFPVVVGPDLTFNGGGSWGDAFVTKVNAAGTVLDYCGYIGGADTERGEGIAVDGDGNAYVTGYTKSTEASFPVLVGPDLTHNGGNEDAFVAQVNAVGIGLVYCGYIGGTGGESGKGIAVDDYGNAYVRGWTSSTEASFPVVVGPDLTYNGGTYDAFVAKISPTGTWSCANPPQYDYNDDCLVTVADLFDFCGHWLEPGADPKYDTSGDGRVNLEDYQGLAAAWLECGRFPSSACP